MTPAVPLVELLDYSDHERRKWREWVSADPGRLDIPFQSVDAAAPGGAGRFPTIGRLFDHAFLVERRHLARLQGSTPPDTTGVAPGDWNALFDYADLVRADLRAYLAGLDDEHARQTMKLVVQSGPSTMTRRALATHIVLHEIRHLAQIAYAARRAGHEPPGRHDYFYFVGS